MKWAAEIGYFALAAVLFFGAGWYTKGQFVKADKVEQVTAALQDSATAVVDSARASSTITTAIQADANRTDTIRVALAQRLSRPLPERIHDLPLAPAESTPLSDCRAADPVLDAGTVRLLNAARTGIVVDTILGGAAEKRPAAGPDARP